MLQSNLKRENHWRNGVNGKGRRREGRADPPREKQIKKYAEKKQIQPPVECRERIGRVNNQDGTASAVGGKSRRVIGQEQNMRVWRGAWGDLQDMSSLHVPVLERPSVCCVCCVVLCWLVGCVCVWPEADGHQKCCLFPPNSPGRSRQRNGQALGVLGVASDSEWPPAASRCTGRWGCC